MIDLEKSQVYGYEDGALVSSRNLVERSWALEKNFFSSSCRPTGPVGVILALNMWHGGAMAVFSLRLQFSWAFPSLR